MRIDIKKNLFFSILAAFIFLTGAGIVSAAGMTSVDMPKMINTETVEGVLGNLTTYLRSIAGFVAVLFIVIGGIMYMMSGGNKEMVERGKRTLLYALAGLAVVLAAPTFYMEITKIIGSGGVAGISGSSLSEIAVRTLNLLLSIAGGLAIISLLIGAIWMFTAMGDQNRLELGKKTVIYSIIGIAIVAGSLIIAKQVATLLGAS